MNPELKVYALEAASEKLLAENVTLKEANDSLKIEVDTLRKERDDAVQKAMQKESVIFLNDAQLSEASANLKLVTVARDTAVEKLKSHEDGLIKANNRITELEVELAKYKDADELGLKVASAVTLGDYKTTPEHEDPQKCIAELQAQLTNANTYIGARDATIARLENEIKHLTRQHELLEADHEEMKAAAANVEEAHQKHLAEMEVETNDVGAKLERRQQWYAEQTAKVKKLEATLASEKKDRDAAETELRSVRAQLNKDLNDAEDRVAELETQVGEITAERDQFKHWHNEQMTKSSKAQLGLRDAENEKKRLENEANQLRGGYANIQEEYGKLECELSEAKEELVKRHSNWQKAINKWAACRDELYELTKVVNKAIRTGKTYPLEDWEQAQQAKETKHATESDNPVQ